MKKSTKGAIAAGAAAVLLLGGAGTLAYWSDSATVPGGSVNTGELALSDGDCDTAWTYAASNSAQPGQPVTNIVPGDTIAKECTFTITAEGDNLEAELTAPDTVSFAPAPAASTLDADVAVSYVVGDAGDVDTVITEANDGETVTATITVTFPFGDETAVNANDTQNLLVTLGNITVDLEQIES